MQEFIIFLIFYIIFNIIFNISINIIGRQIKEKFKNDDNFYLVSNISEKYYLTENNGKLILTTDKSIATKYNLDKNNILKIKKKYLTVNEETNSYKTNSNLETSEDTTDSSDKKYYNIIANDKIFYPPTSGDNGVMGKILSLNNVGKYLSIRDPNNLLWATYEGPATLYLEMEK